MTFGRFVKMWKKALLMMIVVCLHLSSADLPAFHLSAAPTDMTISTSSDVYISAGRTLYSLNGNLILGESVLVTTGNTNVSRMALSSNDSRIVLCLTDGSCLVYATEFLALGRENTLASVTVPGETVALLSVPTTLEDTFYVGSEGAMPPRGIQLIALGQYGLDEFSYTSRTSGVDLSISNDSFVSRDFFTAFSHGEFVYFVVMDNGTAPTIHNIRILRLCNNANESYFGALYEVRLECGTLAPGTKIASFSLVDMSGTRAVIGVTGDGQNHFCSFQVSDVDREIERTFDECLSGSSEIPIAWASADYIDDCSHFTAPAVTECDFGSANAITFIPALASDNAVTGTVFLDLGSDIEVITSALAARIDSTLLLFVAYSNTSQHYLAKYHILENMQSVLVEVNEITAPLLFLRWAEGQNYMYAANETTVYKIDLGNCTAYNTCESCARSVNPLCGWCVLENHCSRIIFCQSASLQHRWVQSANKCISDLQLLIDIRTEENFRDVEVFFQPSTAYFPELNQNENEFYLCFFENSELQYNFTTPFNGTTCIIQDVLMTFNGSVIVLNLSLVPSKVDMLVFSANGVLSLHNCSLLTSCRQCVQSSDVCGWCVYNHICTGTSSRCQMPQHWITLMDTEEGSSHLDVCPGVLPPARGYYIQPVAVDRVLVVHTRNLPTPIPGYNYTCVLEYNNGSSVRVPAMYAVDEENPLTCHIGLTQFSQLSHNGVEGVRFRLLWVSQNGSYQYEVDQILQQGSNRLLQRMPRPPVPHPPPSPNMVLYDCSQLGSGCSSCLAANIGTGFDCGWCTRSSAGDSCSVMDNCIDDFFSRFTTHAIHCPTPVISLIYPGSGPTAGGTMVTITGTELGVNVEDILSILFGNSPCQVDENSYIPGRQIICNTSDSTTAGEVNVELRVRRGHASMMADPLTSPTFLYAVPTIDSVSPLFGPSAGGTMVRIRGSSLNISDTNETRVRLAGLGCPIRNISSSEIVCETAPAAVSLGLVRLSIDNAVIYGGQFEYTRNPEFNSIYPHYTIPAGGVTLTFVGNYLHAVQQPVLVINTGNASYSNVCKSVNSTALNCAAPRLPLSTLTRNARVVRSDTVILNYSIRVDNAEGPSSDNPSLQLSLKPNPIFMDVHEEDRQYTSGSENTIRILGQNFDSVLPREIAIVVGDESCNITAVTARITTCKPPDYEVNHSRSYLIKVVVADGSLVYNVGYLRYLASTSATEGLIMNVVVPIAVIAILLGIIVVVVLVILVLYCTKRNKILERVLEPDGTIVQEDKPIQMNTVTNFYNLHVSSSGREGNTHVYEVVPDCVQGAVFGRDQPDNPSGTTLNSANDNEESNPNLCRASISSEGLLEEYPTATNWGKKSMKQRALPPIPLGCDEYVEMRSHSVSQANDDAPGDITARYITHGTDGKVQFGLQHQTDSSKEVTRDENQQEDEKEGKNTDRREFTLSIEEYIDMTRGSRTSSIGDPTSKSWCSTHVSSTSC